MVQREFIELSDELEDLSGQIIEAEDAEKGDLREKQKELRVRQGEIAEEINHWRTLSRRVMQQAGAGSMRSFLTELLDADDERVQIAAKNSLHLLDRGAGALMLTHGLPGVRRIRLLNLAVVIGDARSARVVAS